MDTRRLPLVLLLLLLPVPARADRHSLECSAGISPEKEQSLAARGSCGVAVKGWPLKAVIALGGGIPRLQEARPASTDPLHVDGGLGKAKRKTAIFLVTEVAEYIAGRDSGEELDSLMFGGRVLLLGEKPVEPFFHILGGKVHPARSEAIAEDVTTESAFTWVVGGGADLEINPSLHTGIVPVLRLQLDAVKPKDVDVYGRVTFGLSFRFEGSGK